MGGCSDLLQFIVRLGLEIGWSVLDCGVLVSSRLVEKHLASSLTLLANVLLA